MRVELENRFRRALEWRMTLLLERIGLERLTRGVAKPAQYRIDRLMEDGRLRLDELEQLGRVRRSNRILIREPLVLISQIQRSGGTLLSQLFDMHPACHAHPHELHIGYPTKQIWPELRLSDPPETWFRMLFEAPALKSFYDGYTKYGRGQGSDFPAFPFLFLPSLQRQIFEDCVRAVEIHSARAILDAYMTAYFNAWIDNGNLYGSAKKLVTAFVPRLVMDEDSVARFFADYPDGTLVSLIRDPWTWFPSARVHKPSVYGDLEIAMSFWCESNRSIVSAKRRYGARVRIVGFTDLVTHTEATMRALVADLGIAFDPVLLAPTFNGFAIKADSSFPVDGHGVRLEPIRRRRDQLTAAERERIDAAAGDLYREVMALRDHAIEPA